MPISRVAYGNLRCSDAETPTETLDSPASPCYLRCVQTQPIIDAVAAEQRALRLTDAEVAARIGCSRQMWNFLKRGIRQPEVATLQGIAAGFPNLREAVRSFVAPHSTKVAAVRRERKPAALPA